MKRIYQVHCGFVDKCRSERLVYWGNELDEDLHHDILSDFLGEV